MQSYERAPDTVYVGSHTVIRGYANIRAHYAAGYKAGMGTLTIANTVVRPLGKNYAVVVARWRLAGTGGSRNTGLFTLVLHRGAAGWKIITDHSP
jgi:ketosteroid isomerase-like protein